MIPYALTSVACTVSKHCYAKPMCMGTNSTEGQGTESEWQELNAAALTPSHLMSSIVVFVAPELVLKLAVRRPKDYRCVGTR